ncbi:hypothetical protein ACXR6G_18320 [Ancylomarina sp. YFZ004]
MIDVKKSTEENLFTFRKLFSTYVNRSFKDVDDCKWQKSVRIFLSEDNQMKIVELSEGISVVLLSELHLWCEDVIDRVRLSSLALKLGETKYAQSLMDEASTLVEDFEDGYAVLKASVINKLLSDECLSELFNSALQHAKSQKEYLDLTAIGEALQISNELTEDCLNIALDFEITFEGSLLLAEYYSAIDQQKSWDWYINSFQFWEDAGCCDDIFYSLEKSSLPGIKKNKLVDYILSIEDDLEDRFLVLEHYYEYSSKIDIAFAVDFLQDCIDKKEWSLINDCIDKFNLSIPDDLKLLIENQDLLSWSNPDTLELLKKDCDFFNLSIPEHFMLLMQESDFKGLESLSDVLAYAELTLKITKNKEDASFWFRRAMKHVEESEITQVKGSFHGRLVLAEDIWHMLHDDYVLHFYLYNAYRRQVNDDKNEVYGQHLKEIITVINRTSKNTVELKRYFDLILSEKHLSSTYCFACKMAYESSQEWLLVDKLYSKALKTVESFDDVFNLYKLCNDVNIFRYDNSGILYVPLKISEQKMLTTNDALRFAKEINCIDALKYRKNIINRKDLAKVKFDTSKDRMDSILSKAVEFANCTEDYQNIIRFVNFDLKDTPRALEFIKKGFNSSSIGNEYNMLCQESKLILGCDWESAF